MAAILIFKCTEGVGVGDYSCRGRGARNRHCPLSSFDTRARWQPVTQSARSRRSYGKIEDCEQSNHQLTWYKTLWLCRWLPPRLSKRQSLSATAVLLRTTFTNSFQVKSDRSWAKSPYPNLGRGRPDLPRVKTHAGKATRVIKTKALHHHYKVKVDPEWRFNLINKELNFQ